ncbi:MAG: hypothetical protein N2202_01470 [Proteobacteria bacterium]|nr:hypothetical protein [Pseudomonadota bacterium]
MKVFLNYFIMLTMLVSSAITIKLNYDPKKGYSYTITGPNAEEVIDAEIKIKNYIRKGKIPVKQNDEKK